MKSSLKRQTLQNEFQSYFEENAWGIRISYVQFTFQMLVSFTRIVAFFSTNSEIPSIHLMNSSLGCIDCDYLQPITKLVVSL